MPLSDPHEKETSIKRRIANYEKRLISLKKRLANVTELNMTGDLLRDLCNMKGWRLDIDNDGKYRLQILQTSPKYESFSSVISECKIVGVAHRYEETYFITITCDDVSTLCGFAHAYGIIEIRNEVFDPTEAIKDTNRELKDLEIAMKKFNDVKIVFKSLLKKKEK